MQKNKLGDLKIGHVIQLQRRRDAVFYTVVSELIAYWGLKNKYVKVKSESSGRVYAYPADRVVYS